VSLAAVLYFEFVGMYILLLWAVYLPFRGGQLYNGPFFCMAIGAYIAAYTAKVLHWPTGLSLFVALISGAGVGFLLSLAFSQTTGLVTATASLALIFVIQAVIRNIEFLGGPNGMWNIPKMPYLPVVIWVGVLLVGALIYRIDRSRIGRALEAMRTDPALAGSLGVNSRWLSVFVMTVSSAIGSLSGVFCAFAINAVTVDTFGFTLLLSTMAMLFIGGRYTMWGVVISVPVLWGIPQVAPPWLAPYMNIIYGALLVAVLAVRPEGIVSREMTQNLKNRVGNLLRRINRIPG